MKHLSRPAIALAILLTLCLLLLFAQLGSLGVWEPWEARQLLTAIEYQQRPPFDPALFEQNPSASGYNWAVPTLEQKPVASSLLQTWLIGALLPAQSGDIREVVGALERNARLPFALLSALLVFATYAWTRRRFSPLQALLAATALVSLPVVAFGAHNLATPLLFLTTTSFALLAAFELVYAESTRARALASAGLAASLLLAAFDQRLTSLFLVLGVLATSALLQIPFSDPSQKDRPKLSLPDVLAPLIVLLLPLLYLGLLYMSAPDYDAAAAQIGAPHMRQILLVLFPTSSILAAFLAARRTPTTRALLLSPYGLIPILLAIGAIAFLGHAYGEVNPTLLKRGEVFGNIPSLSFLLGNVVDPQSIAREHVRFEHWLRQIGFATFPWAALIPAGLAHLARNLRSPSLPAEQEHPEDTLPSHTPAAQAQRFLLAWVAASLFVIAVASTQDHIFYPAYVPLAIACGLLLGDVPFWRHAARFKPIVPYLVGMSAVAIILMLGKDLERYPYRFIEVYTEMPKKLELPADFSWGKSYKPLKYLMALTLIFGFFGPLSWALLQLRDLPSLRQRFQDWRQKRSPRFAPITPADTTPMEARAEARVALIEGEGPAPKNVLVRLALPIARLFERPTTRALLVAGVFTLFSLLTLFSYIHKATDHLSQRHIFETYLQSSTPEQPLVGYQTPDTERSLYLRDISKVNSQELLTRMSDSERFFAVIPRDRLAQVNSDVRARLKRNVNVLDARSNKLVLISNQLSQGQEDQNFLAKYILDPSDALPAEIQHPVTFEGADGQQTHALFDNQLEFLGYSLDKPGERSGQGVPAYKWGESIELALYFRVKQRVPGNQQVFVHIDTRGNRIAGDHYPAGGDFPTNTWLPGDIVRDVHTIPVESYSSTGDYTLNFGFYIGSNRMKVTPPKANDGSDRLTIGHIQVTR